MDNHTKIEASIRTLRKTAQDTGVPWTVRMREKWEKLPLPAKIALIVGGGAAAGATLAGLGGLAYYLYDPKGAKRKALQAAHWAAQKTEKGLKKMDKEFPMPDIKGIKEYGILSTAGPGVGVGPESIPVFAGVDLTGVDLGVKFRPKHVANVMKPFMKARYLGRIKRNLPPKMFAALRFSPTMFPFEAGVLVEREDVGKVRRMATKLRKRIEQKLQQPMLKLAAEEYDYSCTMVQAPGHIADRIRDLATRIAEEDIYNEDMHGREDDPHVTIKYGIHSADPAKLKEAFTKVRPFEVKLGRLSVFDNDKYDVLKVRVTGQGLHDANRLVSATERCTDTFPTYNPHMTIAYLKPGTGRKYVGDRSLEGETFRVDRILFSGKDGNHVWIPLERSRA